MDANIPTRPAAAQLSPQPAAHSKLDSAADTPDVLPGYATVTLPASSADNRSQDLSVRILGASGDVGSFAVLLAKHLFAVPLVVATCSACNAQYVQQLGADVIIDYSNSNVEQVSLYVLWHHQQQQAGSAASSSPKGPQYICWMIYHPTLFHLNDDPTASKSSRDNLHNHRFDLVIDNVGGADHMAMGTRLLKPATGLYISSIPLADPAAHPILPNVLLFFVRLGCYLQAAAPFVP